MNFTRHTMGAAAALLLGIVPAMAQSGQPAARGRPAVPAAAPAAPASQAIAFKCPAAGLAIDTTMGGQIRERTSQGADPGNATLCLSKSGFSTSSMYFGMFSSGMAPEGLAALRQGMAELLAGSKTEFTARYQAGSSGGRQFMYESTWRRLGTEPLTIASRPVTAVAFERANRGLDGNTFAGTEKLWLDPATGLWVKRARVSGGERDPNFAIDWEITKIVAP